jgi:ABC-type sugar transport system ATPase subunit
VSSFGASVRGTVELPVEARGLTKHYGRIAAVDGVDLAVHAGDIYGFLGPNGAGQSRQTRREPPRKAAPD